MRNAQTGHLLALSQTGTIFLKKSTENGRFSCKTKEEVGNCYLAIDRKPLTNREYKYCARAPATHGLIKFWLQFSAGTGPDHQLLTISIPA